MRLSSFEMHANSSYTVQLQKLSIRCVVYMNTETHKDTHMDNYADEL